MKNFRGPRANWLQCLPTIISSTRYYTAKNGIPIKSYYRSKWKFILWWRMKACSLSWKLYHSFFRFVAPCNNNLKLTLSYFCLSCLSILTQTEIVFSEIVMIKTYNSIIKQIHESLEIILSDQKIISNF